jgi:hypothetical protein
MSRGNGTIYWDESKKSFRGEISLGYTPAGKRRRRRAYGATKAAVRDKLRELRDEATTGVTSSARYTVSEAVQDWLDRGLVGRDVMTVEKNRILARTHVIPGLGKAKLRELKADDVDDWLATLVPKLATRSIRDCLAVLRRAIVHAQRANQCRSIRQSPYSRPARELEFVRI